MTGEDRRYTDCVDDAHERLTATGFEFGPNFAVHAPMVAETLATLGYYDTVPSWIEENRRRRHYGGLPVPTGDLPSDPAAARRVALGDYRRVADWVRFFERRLAERPWQEVLVEWWPYLLDGAFTAFTHGLIRTAHAVRSLRTVPEPGPLTLGELARGLAYWAARYTPTPGGTGAAERDAVTARTVAEIPAVLSGLTAEYAGRYAELGPRPPVPAVHAVTAPAALRLVLPVLPDELRLRTCAAAAGLAAAVWNASPTGPRRSPATADGYRPPSTGELVEQAVELGEEHTIKLAEACLREHEHNPDDRYRAAVHTLILNCR